MKRACNIVRRPDFAGGGLTDEEREQLAAHTAKWIDIALSTKPANPLRVQKAVHALYTAAALPLPRVIVVPSPLVMALAGGLAALVWALRSAATRDVTYVATDDAIYEATDAATRDATRAATDAAAWLLSLAQQWVGRQWAPTALKCAALWTRVYQGGNMWAAWPCYLAAWRDVLGLRLPVHRQFAAWEQAAIEGGFRWMHPQFCLVTDRPEVLKVDSQHRPHAEFGPSHRWRDGWSLWHLHGISVPQWLAEAHPDDLDARRILQIENVDVRREGIRRAGMQRLIGQLQPRVLDGKRLDIGGKYRLLAVDMNHGEPWHYLEMVNQSTGAVHLEAVPRDVRTVREALNYRARRVRQGAGNTETDWRPSRLT